MIIVAVSLVALFGFTALAVDVGRMYLERRRLQSAADASALAGAQAWYATDQVNAGPLCAAKTFVGLNPTQYHPYIPGVTTCTVGTDPARASGYKTAWGDAITVETAAQAAAAADTDCKVGSEYYDCVKSAVVAPAKSAAVPTGFNWLFAHIIGFSDRSVKAKAVAIIGQASVKADRVVPWVLIDCPRAPWDGAGNNPADTASLASIQANALTVNSSCPYRYASGTSSVNVYNDVANRTTLFFDGGTSGAGRTFAAGIIQDTNSGCPATASGFFKNNVDQGTQDYIDNHHDANLCPIAPGARIWTTNAPAPATYDGMYDRGVMTSNCTNAAAFANVVDAPTVPGLPFVIKGFNPCLIALPMGVHMNSTMAADYSIDQRGTSAKIYAWQHADPLNATSPAGGRFSGPSDDQGGVPLLVRRIAYFYITNVPNNRNTTKNDGFSGIFLRGVSLDSRDLEGPAADAGVVVVKLAS
jgi:Putative Flp pilus-assembly TadE/G-like